jgi:hypothetical protein
MFTVFWTEFCVYFVLDLVLCKCVLDIVLCLLCSGLSSVFTVFWTFIVADYSLPCVFSYS